MDEPQQRKSLLESERAAREAAEQALKLAQAEVQRLRKLHKVTDALGHSLTREQVADVILHQALEALDAFAGAVYVKVDNDKALTMVGCEGYPELLVPEFARFPVDAIVPTAVVARTGTPVFLANTDAALREYGDLSTLVNEMLGIHAVAVLPLSIGQDVIGSLVLRFHGKTEFTDENKAYMGTLAGQCAQALERARLYEAERTARREAEREREDFEAVLSVVPVGIGISRDPECRDIRVNPAFAAQLGIAPEVNASKTGEFAAQLPFVVRKDGREVSPDMLPMQRAARENRIIRDSQFEIAHADGRVVQLLEYAAPLYDETGKVRGAVGAFVDVTERMHLLERERAARADAEAASRAKSDFLATMSHELRTPLNAIGGYAELIELGIHGPVTAEQLHALERIRASQRHLLGLINEVLNFTRLEAGVVRYEIRPVSLAQTVATCEALTAPQIGSKGLVYECSPIAESVRVLADPERMQQIMLNILSNAIKFTDVGGRIRVTIEINESVVAIAVADSGRGIPAERLDHIFEPFVQVDTKLVRGQEGIGLGLAISRDLARGMNGDLTVQSQVGVGSTFTLQLPIAS